MPAPKFSFQKITEIKSDNSGYFVRISSFKDRSGANMYFQPSMVRAHDWGGKMIEFLADPGKNAVAFRFLPQSLRKENWNKKTMKMIKENAGGVVQIGATHFLKAARIPINDYKCPLLKYEDTTYGEMYYIQPEQVIAKRQYKKEE